MIDRLRVAYFSPLPPAPSGIADYSAELLPHLALLADLTLYTDAVAVGVSPTYRIRPLDSYPDQRPDHDVALYHMGNSAAHAGIYELLSRYPGVVVLHDVFLHHFIADATVGKGNYGAYAREVGYALGRDGVALAGDIRAGRKPHPLYDEPLSERVIDSSLGLIVHSDYAAGLVRARRPGANLQVITHLAQARAGTPRRAELRLPEDATIFAMAGQVTAAKQLPFALAAFRALLEDMQDAHFLVIGEVLPEVDAAGAIEQLGLADHVTLLGRVDTLEAFVDWIDTADVVLNLREPTLGETSGPALRALGAGRPLIVFDSGWYAELPDTAARKVAPMDKTVLTGAMRELAASPALRREMGEAGRHYVETVCRPDHVAAAYDAFLRETLQSLWPVR